MSVSKIVAAAASGVGGAGLDVDEVFDTFLYTSTGSTISVNNGIDLSGEGGLVWFKGRNTTREHFLYDTERGTGKALAAAQDNSQFDIANALTAFNSNGFNIGTYDSVNSSDVTTQVAWTFRKAEKFFDVVTYTGNGVAGRTVSHNLGSVPGMILVKRTDATKSWAVFHRQFNSGSSPANYWDQLNNGQAIQSNSDIWNNTAPTSSVFSVGTANAVNDNGGTYVAYVFAHNNNDGGFGPDSDQDIIKCGSYQGNGSTTGPVVNLGFEPQFLMIKKYQTGSGSWEVVDTMRGFTFDNAGDAVIRWNSNGAENTGDALPVGRPTATGFQITSDEAPVNGSGKDYIYMAIRRGPLAVPDDATKVFGIDTLDSTAPGFDSNFVVDMAFERNVSGESDTRIASRLTGETTLRTNTTGAETAATSNSWDYMDGWFYDLSSNSSKYSWMWKRAPSFFDVVAYTGTGSNRTVSHNLSAVPEMMWVKRRDGTSDWAVYHKGLNGGTDPEDYFLKLNGTNAASNSSTRWNDTAPTSSVFTVGTSGSTNDTNFTYIAYLFATVAGVSKVGSYTGNGSSQNIDCGFSNGARFVLLKKYSTTGGWNLYDTTRGLVAGNDHRLQVEDNGAEITDADQIDPLSSGFTVVDNTTNQNGHSFIFYAIA